jgi:hypothetical protein
MRSDAAFIRVLSIELTISSLPGLSKIAALERMTASLRSGWSIAGPCVTLAAPRHCGHNRPKGQGDD